MFRHSRLHWTWNTRRLHDTHIKYIIGRIKSLEDLSQPERILNQLDELLEETLKLKEYDVTNFGMDAGVCCFSRKKNLLLYSGAKIICILNMIILFRNTKVTNQFRTSHRNRILFN